ncbi:hypothetical protein FRC17_003203 [Serendipita sp. 399]|nr:hypothetical protein FRC17_003203 [Serendipita sp. 399]
MHPKVKSLRQKAAKHQSAAKSKVQAPAASTQEDDDTELVEDITSEPGDNHVQLNKKERRLLKRELFQEYVTESLENPVHSKSARRRAKRRERERREVDMREMKDVLKTMSLPDEIAPSLGLSSRRQQQLSDSEVGEEASRSTHVIEKKKIMTPGLIGESTRTKPPTKDQKRKELCVSSLGFFLVLP